MTKLDELKDQVFHFKIYGYPTGRHLSHELTKNGDPTCSGEWNFRCRGNLEHIGKTLMGVAEKCKEKGNGYSIFRAVSAISPSGYTMRAWLENECLEIKAIHFYDQADWITIYSGPAKDFPLLKRKEKAND